MNYRRLFGVSVLTNLTTLCLYLNSENNYNYIKNNCFILHKSDYQATEDNGLINYKSNYTQFILH